MIGEPLPDPHKWTALALAVGVHGLLAAFLVLGVSWRNPPPAAIQVELVRESPASAPKAVTRDTEPRPLPRPETPPPPPKPQPVPLPKPDIAIKDKEKPKPPPKAVPVAVPTEEDIRPKRDQRLMQERQSEALAREMQQLENLKRQQQLERELSRAREDQAAAARAEAAARDAATLRAAEAQAGAARSRMIAGYQDRIRGKIRGNIVRPPELRGNPVARFDVTQLPSGEVLDVVMTASSGNRAWDESVERAIRKSSPLPKAEASDVYQRLLHLTFCPDEERGCR